jgi:hypothetical protein
MNSQEFRAQGNELFNEWDAVTDHMAAGIAETDRVINVISNSEMIFDDLDKDFCKKTELTTVDISILFTAIALQLVRQYFTSFPERIGDQEAAKKNKHHEEEHSNRKHKYYNPSLEEIITNPVPFDAIDGADGALSGGGKFGHRSTTLGHDAILGLVFGTANIATATLTTNKFVSYHITTNEKGRDSFGDNASTFLVIKYTIDKLLHEGMEGKKKVAASFVKEIIHLQTDLYTKNSLPLPIISVFSTEMANFLASYGFDMANTVTVGKQATYAELINMLIAMLHGMLYDGKTEQDKKLFEVRTRKIISYSNVVATSANATIVAFTKDIKKLDVGGLGITIYHLISDRKFIRQVKEEFINDSYGKLIEGDFQ